MADARIVSYILENREKLPEQQLRANLLAEGVSEKDIEAAFGEVRGYPPFEINPPAATAKNPSGNLMFLVAAFLVTTLLVYL